MSYQSVGITDMALIYKAEAGSNNTPSGTNPLTSLFDFIKGAGLKIENALLDPKVQKFMAGSPLEH